MLQITDNAKEQQLLPLFRLAFRPFFLVGSIFAIISMMIWGLLLSAKMLLSARIDNRPG